MCLLSCVGDKLFSNIKMFAQLIVKKGETSRHCSAFDSVMKEITCERG